MKKDIVFFDLETTGFNTPGTRILQLGLVHVSGETFGVITTKSWYFAQTQPVPTSAAAVNGLSMEMVNALSDNLTFETQLDSFLPYFEGDYLLSGYNINNFDIPILDRCLSMYGIRIDFSPERSVDLLPIARNTISASKYNLETVYKHLVKRDGLTEASFQAKLKPLMVNNQSRLHDAVYDSLVSYYIGSHYQKEYSNEC